MVRAPGEDAPRTPPSGGVSGMSHREETPGSTQDTLEGLYLSAGLGTPQMDPPGRAGGSSWGEGDLGFPAEAAAPATRIKWKTTSTIFDALRLLAGLVREIYLQTK